MVVRREAIKPMVCELLAEWVGSETRGARGKNVIFFTFGQMCNFEAEEKIFPLRPDEKMLFHDILGKTSARMNTTNYVGIYDESVLEI